VAKDKTFIGSCKKIKDWGIEIGIQKSDLDKLKFNERGYCNITVIPNLNDAEKKPYAYLNEFEPKKQ
jgi:hypothetical protein